MSSAETTDRIAAITETPRSAHGDAAIGEPSATGDQGNAISAEPRGARLARRARRVRLYASAGAFVALLALLVLLVSRNTGAAKVDWVVGSTHASIAWIILAAAVFGWLLGITTAAVVRRRTRRAH